MIARIRMVTTAAGPFGVMPAGSVVEMPAVEAAAFLHGGYAIAADAPPEVADAPPPEVAAPAPPPAPKSRAKHA